MPEAEKGEISPDSNFRAPSETRSSSINDEEFFDTPEAYKNFRQMMECDLRGEPGGMLEVLAGLENQPADQNLAGQKKPSAKRVEKPEIDSGLERSRAEAIEKHRSWLAEKTKKLVEDSKDWLEIGGVLTVASAELAALSVVGEWAQALADKSPIAGTVAGVSAVIITGAIGLGGLLKYLMWRSKRMSRHN